MPARITLLLLALLAPLPAAATAACPAPGRGAAMPIGGALRPDNEAVWQRVVDLAGGRGARIAVFPTASGKPERSGKQIVDALRQRGADAFVVPLVAPDGAPPVHPPRGSEAFAESPASAQPGDSPAGIAHDPKWVARVRAAGGVYFSGGAQERIVAALRQPDGAPTPMLHAIREVQRCGGVVAGSSAGAAVMSALMFRDAQDVLKVMHDWQALHMGREIDHGLGFAPAGLFVDQHFLKRGRVGRMLAVMAAHDLKLGLGVDENTAAVIRDGQIEIVGYKGALLVDLHAARRDPAEPRLNLAGARLSYLDRGDRYELATRQVVASAAKQREALIDPHAPGFKPYFADAPFETNILGDTAVANLMAQLLDSPAQEARALAFSPDRPGGAAADTLLGYEFVFRKGPESWGRFSGAFGGEDYTVANILLDVRPVLIDNPAYRSR